LRPATLYGAAKHATHAVARAYAREVGGDVAWGRVFFLYGPGENRQRLVPSVALALLAGREALTTDGSQIRDFMHVDDVARAFVALMDSGVAGAVNLASGEGVAVRDVITAIGEIVGRPDLVRLGALPRPAEEPRSLVADVGRLQQEVRFRPRITLAEGIAETVTWWRDWMRCSP
jgi:nucleoside-diphosphate-sugar epimerase